MGTRVATGGTSPQRVMALSFALGSACFLVGSFPGYVNLVGATADAVTFFAGSLLFTTGGALQTWLAAGQRHRGTAGRAAWMAAVTQSAGTICFNISTFRAMQTVIADAGYDRLVWRPDTLGSICFLVSGVIAYRASARRGWWPARGQRGWWQPGVNLLGCVFFGVAAIAGYVLPAGNSMIDQTAVNVTTCAGAVCFLACALGARPTRQQVMATRPPELPHGTLRSTESNGAG